MESSDYYKLLGVDPASSAKDIGKAFRQLARKVHPDKLPQGSSEAEQLRAKQRFQQVAKAWEVLGDPEKRAHYDAERAAAQEVPQRPRPARGQPGAPERRFREELRRAKQQEKKKEREAEESRKERERDKTGGLGGHWVPPSSHFEPKGPERSGGLHHWSGWSAARNEDVHSDTSSVLSFDLRVDLNDLDLRFAEKISADDELDEVWEMRKVKTPTPETGPKEERRTRCNQYPVNKSSGNVGIVCACSSTPSFCWNSGFASADFFTERYREKEKEAR
eukprot:g19017.t1